MPSATATRQNIPIQLNPDSVTEGDTSKVWILANCPLPQGGPAHTGRATSEAFVSAVTLNSAPATGSPTSTGAATLPWVRGQAEVARTTKPGTYTVDVKCEGTNDTGRATLRVLRDTPATKPPSTRTATPRPTKIGAGGGGTFGKDVDDEGGFPLGPAGIVLGLAAAGALGLVIRRRRA